jgi:uncharacterized OsmC-like protein
MGASEINGVDTEGLKETVGQISKQPELGKCEFRLHNDWVTGDQNRSSARSFYAAGGEQQHKQEFKFQAGEPPLLAGKDEGANPVEFLLSALSGCMTTTIAYYSALNGIKIEKMESDYKGELDLQGIFGLDKNVRPGYKNISVHFKIKTDGPKEKIESFYPFSPVYDVVAKSVPVETIIETY